MYGLNQFLSRGAHSIDSAVDAGGYNDRELCRRSVSLRVFMALNKGKGTFTGPGTIYKAMGWSTASWLPILNPRINLEFNAHFMDTLPVGAPAMVECSITAGLSKGGLEQLGRRFGGKHRAYRAGD